MEPLARVLDGIPAVTADLEWYFSGKRCGVKEEGAVVGGADPPAVVFEGVDPGGLV